jgi:hypothetical protein
MIQVIQIYYIRSRTSKLIFLPLLVIAGTTPPSSSASSTSTSSSEPKLPRNVLPTFKIITRELLDDFKAFSDAIAAFLVAAVALHASATSILACALASRAT